MKWTKPRAVDVGEARRDELAREAIKAARAAKDGNGLVFVGDGIMVATFDGDRVDVFDCFIRREMAL